MDKYPVSVFFPQGKRPSFKPIESNRWNYFNIYACRWEMRRGNILKWMAERHFMSSEK
jgi:hypothetical protein